MMRHTIHTGLAFSAAILAGASAFAQENTISILPTQVTAWVENFNPYNVSSVVPTVTHFVYEPMVIFNSFAGGEPNYRTATAHSYSDDLSSVTFTLRDGVKWSDGEAFDAEDVAFSFDLVLNNAALDTFGMSKIVSSVEVLDPLTVKFDLAAPSSQAVFEIVRVPIVAQHTWADVTDPVTFTNPDPVGTGAMTEFTRFTEQEYIQCRNPNYWDNANLNVDCLRVPQIANNDQALAAAANGELDWMGSFLPDIENTYVAKDPDNHRYWLPGGSLVMFNMNLKSDDAGNSTAFNDVNFRRAVSMSFDREAMVEIAGYGYPTINAYPSGLGSAFHAWNNPEVDEKFGAFTQYSPEDARALLAESGYADKDGDGFVEAPNGEAISFDIIVPNGWTDWVNTVQIAVEGLTEVGIKANVATPEAAIWTEKLLGGDYDFAINAISVGTTPYNHFERGLHQRNQGISRFAAARWDNSKVSNLLDAFTQTNDLDEQKEIIAEVQMVAAEEMPYIAVFNNPLWYQFNTSRFTGFFDNENPVGNPVVHANNPMRVLHLLSLRPVE